MEPPRMFKGPTLEQLIKGEEAVKKDLEHYEKWHDVGSSPLRETMDWILDFEIEHNRNLLENCTADNMVYSQVSIRFLREFKRKLENHEKNRDDFAVKLKDVSDQIKAFEK